MIGDCDWLLGIAMGIRDQGLKLLIGIGDCDWRLGWRNGIGNLY